MRKLLQSTFVLLFVFAVSNVAIAQLHDHLLISEIVVTPTAGEYVEIYNPTGSVVDLTDYYITDATYSAGGVYYYKIVTGVDAGGGGFGDWHARFPAGATINPGEFQTISMAGSQDFFATYGLYPTYELYEDSVAADLIPDMLEEFPGSINGQGGLTNSGEVVILYTWDGISDLVQDVDYAVWGDKVEAVDKSGVSIDGPDPDSTPSTYLNDTPIALQDSLPAGHPSGDSFTRYEFTEPGETFSGGNGLTGHDETSEPLSTTWIIDVVSPNGGTVPVELTSFSASVNGKAVTLVWTTATELNNSGFEVQRATENSNWEKVAFVPGSGTTTEMKTYSYTDKNLTEGTYSYRLKQIDFNGMFEYSNIVNVDITTPIEYSLEQNYPNPFNPSTTIKFSVPEATRVTLTVFNTLGEEIAVLVNQFMEAGTHQVNFNAVNLNSGMYFYRLEAGDFVQVKKMTLLK